MDPELTVASAGLGQTLHCSPTMCTFSAHCSRGLGLAQPDPAV